MNFRDFLNESGELDESKINSNLINKVLQAQNYNLGVSLADIADDFDELMSKKHFNNIQGADREEIKRGFMDAKKSKK
jgi:hypothetical protein